MKSNTPRWWSDATNALAPTMSDADVPRIARASSAAEFADPIGVTRRVRSLPLPKRLHRELGLVDSEGGRGHPGWCRNGSGAPVRQNGDEMAPKCSRRPPRSHRMVKLGSRWPPACVQAATGTAPRRLEEAKKLPKKAPEEPKTHCLTNCCSMRLPSQGFMHKTTSGARKKAPRRPKNAPR